jgi:CSLREA domain-containing protein
VIKAYGPWSLSPTLMPGKAGMFPVVVESISMRKRSLNRSLVLLLLACGPLDAATYTVTRSDDPAPDACAAGDCSLREAVAAANASPDDDRIDLPSALHQLALGQLDVTGTLDIVGTGLDTSTVRGDGLAGVFEVAAGANLRLRDLAIDGPDPVAGQVHRGSLVDAVRSDNGGSVRIERVRITPGGGLVHSLDGPGDIRAQDSELFGVFCGHDSGQCQMHDTELQLLAVYGGDVVLAGSRLSNDAFPVAAAGASIETDGTVLIEDTDVVDTFSGLSFQSRVPERVDIRRMRYLRNGQPLTARLPLEMWIEDSEFADNRNVETGEDGGPGAIHAYLGAIYHIDRTSFINNTGSGDAGGAILVEVNASLWLTNSTFSGNSFTVEAAAGTSRGAAVAVRAGNALSLAEMRHVTVVAPTFMPVGVSGSAFAVLGADAQVHMAVHNSIVRGSCDLTLAPAGQMDFAQGNIKSNGDNCGFDGNDNQLGVGNAAMALGSLGDHGAFGRTYHPGDGSVAIDAAVDAHCTELDQRGYARPSPAVQCDVGAIEAGADDLIFAHDFEL